MFKKRAAVFYRGLKTQGVTVVVLNALILDFHVTQSPRKKKKPTILCSSVEE